MQSQMQDAKRWYQQCSCVIVIRVCRSWLFVGVDVVVLLVSRETYAKCCSHTNCTVCVLVVIRFVMNNLNTVLCYWQSA